MVITEAIKATDNVEYFNEPKIHCLCIIKYQIDNVCVIFDPLKENIRT